MALTYESVFLVTHSTLTVGEPTASVGETFFQNGARLFFGQVQIPYCIKTCLVAKSRYVYINNNTIITNSTILATYVTWWSSPTSFVRKSEFSHSIPFPKNCKHTMIDHSRSIGRYPLEGRHKYLRLHQIRMPSHKFPNRYSRQDLGPLQFLHQRFSGNILSNEDRTV